MGGPRSGSFAGFNCGVFLFIFLFFVINCSVIKSQHKGLLFAVLPLSFTVFSAKEIFYVIVILLNICSSSVIPFIIFSFIHAVI